MLLWGNEMYGWGTARKRFGTTALNDYKLHTLWQALDATWSNFFYLFLRITMNKTEASVGCKVLR